MPPPTLPLPPSPVQVEAACVGPLLRLDVKLVQSGLSGSWGVQVDRVAIRDMAASTLVEFTAGGQWLGASPPRGDPPPEAAASASGASSAAATAGGALSSAAVALVGVQSMRLMPAGMCAATFAAR